MYKKSKKKGMNYNKPMDYDKDMNYKKTKGAFYNTPKVKTVLDVE